MDDSIEWVKKHKSTIAHGIERVVDEVTADLGKELRKRDDEKQDLFGRIADLVSKNASLVKENSKLRNQLGHAEEQAGDDTAHLSRLPENNEISKRSSTDQSINPPGGTVSSAEYSHLVEKYNALNEEYKKAKENAKYFQRKTALIKEQNRDMKESVRAWQAYADHNAKKMKIKSGQTSNPPEKYPTPDERDSTAKSIRASSKSSVIKSPTSLSRFSTSPAPQNATRSYQNLTPHRSQAVSGESKDVKTTQPDPTRAMLPPSNQRVDLILPSGDESNEIAIDPPQYRIAKYDASVLQPVSDHLPSSQTTEGGLGSPTGPEAATTEEEDDTPVVISERCLKRKRANASAIKVYEDNLRSDGTPVNPFRIKEEPFSSPELLSRPLTRKDTMDLDDLGAKAIATPRHRDRRHHGLKRNPSVYDGIAPLRHERSTSVPMIKQEPIGEYVDSDTNETFVHRRGHDYSTIVDPEDRAYSEPLETIADESAVLQPIDPNVQSHQERTNEEEPLRKRRKNDAEERQLQKFRMLTESGEEPPPTVPEWSASKLAPNAARENFNRRFRKNVQTPIKGPATATRTPITVKTEPLQNPTPLSDLRPWRDPSSRNAPLSEPRPSSHRYKEYGSRSTSHLGRQYDPRPTSRRSLAQEEQDQTPLRSRPITALKMSDFKPNPKFNQGYSYAFSEVVRNRSDRACLPGCTKPECCGSMFRALAAAAPQLSSSQEEDLLEDYLGDTYDKRKIKRMMVEEREELILQARTRVMAQKHGRHKAAYEGRRTPPGFWRTDFPTTQEEMEDRKKAEEMEREMVEERRREAMRRQGRWLFRDE